MHVGIDRKEFNSLTDERLGWVCMEPTFKLIRGKSPEVKAAAFFWYSSPALLKKWMDEVFEHGWAHGKGGDKLNGKELLIAVSSGGAQNMYQAGGLHNYSYSELLRPFQQSANLTGMIYRQPFVVSGIREVSDEQLESYAADYGVYVSGATALSAAKA